MKFFAMSRFIIQLKGYESFSILNHEQSYDNPMLLKFRPLPQMQRKWSVPWAQTSNFRISVGVRLLVCSIIDAALHWLQNACFLCAFFIVQYMVDPLSSVHTHSWVKDFTLGIVSYLRITKELCSVDGGFLSDYFCRRIL